MQGPQGPQGPMGPQGDTGPRGPKGDTGPQEIGVASIVTFAPMTGDNQYTIVPSERIPLERVSMDNTSLCVLDSNLRTIRFTKAGIFKIQFFIHTYNDKNDDSFDENSDFSSVIFRKIMDGSVYAGGSVWNFKEPSVPIFGQGMFIVVNENVEEFEFVNIGKKNIILKTPSIDNLTTESYYANPVVSILIEYLG